MAPPENVGLAAFNTMRDDEVIEALLACCSSWTWAQHIRDGRPYAEMSELLDAAGDALEAMSEDDLDEALAGHPRIGERTASTHSAWSSQEQAGVAGAADQVQAELAAANREYEQRFGHVYLVCASGRSADELLAILRGRLGNDSATERQVMRAELGKINRIRLDRMIGPARTESS